MALKENRRNVTKSDLMLLDQMILEVGNVFAVEDHLNLAELADGDEIGGAVAVDVVEELPQVPSSLILRLE